MVSGLPSASVALLSRSPTAPSATVKVISSVTVLVSSPSTGALSLRFVSFKVMLALLLLPAASSTVML